MSEMSKVEEVARAICAENCEDYGMLPSIHKSVARAAIQAMRVLTPEMRYAINRWVNEPDDSGAAQHAWDKFIDVALKE